MLKETVVALRRLRYHRPIYEGLFPLRPKPYLTLPFRKEDLRHTQIRPSQLGIGRKIKYAVSEGWMYSQSLADTTGFTFHGAVDYMLPYGFPVVAPCDGIAVSSYYSYRLKQANGEVRKYKGVAMNFGLGYFVQIFNPEQKRYVQIGHLSDISPAIPFSPSIKVADKWLPTNNTLPLSVLKTSPFAIEVKRGEQIGNVGYSGLILGREDYQIDRDRPLVVDPNVYTSWIEPHIHMDEFSRDGKGNKRWRRDIYDIYLTSEHYPSHSAPTPSSMGSNPLFKLDSLELPHFADTL